MIFEKSILQLAHKAWTKNKQANKKLKKERALSTYILLPTTTINTFTSTQIM